MPTTAACALWRKGLDSDIRTAPGLAGFTVSNAKNRGRIACAGDQQTGANNNQPCWTWPGHREHS